MEVLDACRHSPSKYEEDSQSDIHLHAYDEIPRHLKINPYIKTRYCCYLSAKGCLKSMCVLSNELMNIWTHLGMTLIWIPIALYDQIHLIPDYGGTSADHYVHLTYVICVTTCMTASAGYHTFIGHISEDAHFKWYRFDVCGIITGMLGCYIPGLYYGYWCHDKIRNTYLFLLGLLILGSAILICRPKYLSESWRHLRLLHLSSLVAFGIIPAVHWAIISDLKEVKLFFTNIVNLYIILGIAFLIFVTKVPERIFPGKFDAVGSSHNVWHILTAYAFVFWRHAALELMAFRHKNTCHHVITQLWTHYTPLCMCKTFLKS